MQVTFDDGEFGVNVEEMLKQMENVCEKDKKSLLLKCGDILKTNVKKSMNKYKMRSEINKGDYVHMIDDVQSKIKKSKTGDTFLSVLGGKKTAYKWRLLNDGAIGQDGAIRNEANHFLEDAINNSQAELEKEIDEMLRKVVQSE